MMLNAPQLFIDSPIERFRGRWRFASTVRWLSPCLAAGVIGMCGVSVARAQWFSPGNMPATQAPSRLAPNPAPMALTQPTGRPTSAVGAPSHLPAIRQQFAQPASITNPQADSISRSAYPTTNTLPLTVSHNSASQPGSPVDQLVATAAEQERVGNSWQAINSYRQALQMDPRNHRALLSYGRMKHRARDFEGAIMLYQQLLQYYPQDAVALNDLGLCYARMGDMSQAVATLQQAIQQQPDSKRYRNNLAVVFVEAGRYDEALQILIPVHGPAVANYNVAWLLARLGQKEQAVRFLNATLLADPSFTAAVELLTQVDPSSTQVASLPDTASTPVATGGNPVSIYQSAPSPETPPQIQLRSGVLPDTEQARATAAVYQEPMGELPPDLDDYQIPGLDDQD